MPLGRCRYHESCTDLLILSARASAQDWRHEPSSVDRLIAVQAALHVADMFTTSYDLTYGHGREGNPVLRPFDGNPGTLTAVAGLLPAAARRRADA